MHLDGGRWKDEGGRVKDEGERWKAEDRRQESQGVTSQESGDEIRNTVGGFDNRIVWGSVK
jgi:hypothetical protein